MNFKWIYFAALVFMLIFVLKKNKDGAKEIYKKNVFVFYIRNAQHTKMNRFQVGFIVRVLSSTGTNSACGQWFWFTRS